MNSASGASAPELISATPKRTNFSRPTSLQVDSCSPRSLYINTNDYLNTPLDCTIINNTYPEWTTMDDKHSRPGHGKHDSQGEQKAQEVPPKSSARIESREAFESLRKGEDDPSLFDRLSGFTNSAYRFAKRTTDEGIRVGRALIKSQDQLKLMLAAGQSLKDLREVTGLTIAELSEALNLKDKSLLEAVENGTATLS